MSVMSDRARRAGPSARQDDLYHETIAAFGPAIQRVVRAYEADPDARRDLLQDIHLALWRSFATFDGRCALGTWVHRVAHNTAVSYVSRAIRLRRRDHLTLEEIDALPGADSQPVDVVVDRQRARERVSALIYQLEPLDRQVMVLYLEGLESAGIAEVTGLSAGAVATKVYRLKRVLTKRFHGGNADDQ
jgi:RNA polymerase sigma-70 factor (ECF subfamily)